MSPSEELLDVCCALIIIFVVPSFFFFLFYCKLCGVLACIFLCFAGVLIAVDIAWRNHLAVFAICISVFVVCEHRARLSMRYQHGHWLDWM